MSRSFSRPLVLDTTVLSNYASSDSVTWLTTTLADLRTVPAVQHELERGQKVGYTDLHRAVDSLEAGDIEIVAEASDRLQHDYPDVRDQLDPGEAEALVAARLTDGTLVTDDNPARTLADSHDVPVTGSIGLLVRGIVIGELSVETADDWLAT